MVRDVVTVERGERVSVWVQSATGGARIWGGDFVSSDAYGTLVDLGSAPAHFPWESSFWLEDSHGEVIRRIMPDPVLEGSPPELE